MEEGKFTSGKQVEVFRRYYDTGVKSQEKHFNDQGREDGRVQYFHPNGQLEFEYEKKDGVTTGEAKRYFPNGDVKEVIMYNNDGTVGSRIAKDRVNPEFDAEPVVKVANCQMRLTEQKERQMENDLKRMVTIKYTIRIKNCGWMVNSKTINFGMESYTNMIVTEFY